LPAANSAHTSALRTPRPVHRVAALSALLSNDDLLAMMSVLPGLLP
jgi:hypothetical protein